MGLACAIMLLALLLFLAPVAEKIPLAVLAAIVILVAWGIMDWPSLLSEDTLGLPRLRLES